MRGDSHGPAKGRSTSHGGNRRELCTASYGRASQLPDLIASVHRTLDELGQPNTPEGVLTPAVSVRQSVRPEFVICLDCGYRGRMLRRHINRHHGLTRDEYLKRWGLRHDHR